MKFDIKRILSMYLLYIFSCIAVINQPYLFHNSTNGKGGKNNPNVS